MNKNIVKYILIILSSLAIRERVVFVSEDAVRSPTTDYLGVGEARVVPSQSVV